MITLQYIRKEQKAVIEAFRFLENFLFLNVILVFNIKFLLLICDLYVLAINSQV